MLGISPKKGGRKANEKRQRAPEGKGWLNQSIHFQWLLFLPEEGCKGGFPSILPMAPRCNMALNLKRYLGPGSISSRPHQKYDMACIFQICYSLTCRMATSWKAPVCPTEPPNLLESTIRRPSKNTAHSWQRKMACDCSAPKKRFFSRRLRKGYDGCWGTYPTFGEGKFMISLAWYIWHHPIGISKPLTPCTAMLHISPQAVAGSSLHRPEVAGLLAEHHGICQVEYSQISTLTTSKCFKLLCRLYPKGFLHTVNSIYTKFSQTCKVWPLFFWKLLAQTYNWTDGFSSNL